MNQLNEAVIIPQRSPNQERCGKCGDTIARWHPYHRAAVDLDGADPRGINLCPRCLPATGRGHPKTNDPVPA